MGCKRCGASIGANVCGDAASAELFSAQEIVKLPLLVMAMISGFVVLSGFLLGISLVAIAISVGLLLRGRKPRARGPSVQAFVPPPTDPRIAAFCPHLERIEGAMRASGIPIKLLGQGAIQANCRVHRPSLQTKFDPLEPVVYLEHYLAAGSDQRGDPVAEFLCQHCHWRIAVRHPSTCLLSTRWFPAAPARLVAVGEHRIEPDLEVTAIACSPGGRFAAVAAGIYNTPQSFSIWDLAQRKPVGELPAHGEIRCIAWGSNEQTLVTGRGILRMRGQGSQGPSLFVWNVADGAERLRFGNDLFGVRGMATSPNGHWLLVSGMLGKTDLDGSTLDLWDLASGRLLKRLSRLEHHGEAVLPVFGSVAFTPDGALAVAACSPYYGPNWPMASDAELPARWNRGVRAWRVADGQEVDFVPLPMPVQGFSVSSDGTKMVFSGPGFGVWSLSRGELLWDQHSSYTHAMAATNDCGLIARGIGDRDKLGPWEESAVEIYDGNTGELLTLGLHRTPPEAIAFTTDGRSLIAGGSESELRFWTMPSLG